MARNSLIGCGIFGRTHLFCSHFDCLGKVRLGPALDCFGLRNAETILFFS